MQRECVWVRARVRAKVEVVYRAGEGFPARALRLPPCTCCFNGDCKKAERKNNMGNIKKDCVTRQLCSPLPLTWKTADR